MQYPRKIRNYNAFVDAVSYAGRVTKGELPELKLNLADHRGGGMDAPIGQDMGMEGMKAKLTFAEHTPALSSLFGTIIPLTLRGGALGEENFDADAHVYTMRSRVIGWMPGTLETGNDTPLDLQLGVHMFRYAFNGDTLIDIDVEAGKRVIGGVDQLASMRLALGL